MFIELTAPDGTLFSVEKCLIKLWTEARVFLANDTVVLGTLVVVQGIGNYHVIENYHQVSALVTRKKKAVMKVAAEPATVLKMRKPKPNRER